MDRGKRGSKEAGIKREKLVRESHTKTDQVEHTAILNKVSCAEHPIRE